MSDYLDPSDLTVLSDVDDAVVQKWIDKAELRLDRTIRRRGGNLATIALDASMLSVIRDVLENAVLRVLRNPEGFRSESEGDYSYTANPLDSAGNIWFPADDLDDIWPSRSGSIRTIQLVSTEPACAYNPLFGYYPYGREI